METTQLPVKKAALNPLWIITLFFSFTEIMLGYVVFNTQGGIQITLTVFVIIFPMFVSTIFFITLWNRPQHLYAPTDYKNDQAFLDSMKINYSPDKLNKQIENAVNESLNSQQVVDKLKTEKAEVVLKNAADNILNKIKKENFITIDISKFVKHKPEPLILTYEKIKTFRDLGDAVFFNLLESDINLKAYSYGHLWILKNVETGQIYKNSRMITGTPIGVPLDDNRTLEEIGIFPGTKLVVEKVNPANKI